MIFRPNMYMQPIYNPKEKAILYPLGIKYTQTDLTLLISILKDRSLIYFNEFFTSNLISLLYIISFTLQPDTTERL